MTPKVGFVFQKFWEKVQKRSKWSPGKNKMAGDVFVIRNSKGLKKLAKLNPDPNQDTATRRRRCNRCHAYMQSYTGGKGPGKPPAPNPSRHRKFLRALTIYRVPCAVLKDPNLLTWGRCIRECSCQDRVDVSTLYLALNYQSTPRRT